MDLTTQVAEMNKSVTRVTEQVSELAKTLKEMQEGLNQQKKKIAETDVALAALKAATSGGGGSNFGFGSDDSGESSAKKARFSARARIGNQDLLAKGILVGFGDEFTRAVLLKAGL